MSAILSSVQSLMQLFGGKTQEFIDDIDNVHMVWLEEIQQEANRMFSRDFNAEPELMPKTPSQKKNSRRKRVSLGRQEENQAKRRFSKGRRSNLRGTSIKSLNFIAEEETPPEASTSGVTTQPKRTTRKNKQTKTEVGGDVSLSNEEVQYKPVLVEDEEVDKNREVNNAGVEPKRTTRKNKQTEPEVAELEEVDTNREANNSKVELDEPQSTSQPPPKIPSPKVVVSISATDRMSAELAKKPECSPGRTAAKITIAGKAQSSRRSSTRCSLNVRHSLAGLRHSMTQESVRRASRRSMLQRKKTRMGNSTCSSSVDDSCMESAEEEEDGEPQSEAVTADTEVDATADESNKTPEVKQKINPSVGRITRSVAAHSPKLAHQVLLAAEPKLNTPDRRAVVADKQQNSQSKRRSSQSTKRKAPDTVEESPSKRMTPPKKSQSAIRPNMRSFLHTVQKNQMLMMTPNSLGRTGVIKSFIKHTTPLKIDNKLSSGIVTKERHKLEALKKKQEQEEERLKKMEEDKRKKQDELKRKRDERLRRVYEAKIKEEQRKEEQKKKVEQKMAQIDEKNDKRHADEKAKKKLAVKRQEEIEQKRKLEEESRKKLQAEEEKRQQELLAKKKAEEEEELRARKLAEARRALELKREQERERELERERQVAAERERLDRERALALQREVERAAREKERRELEEKRKALEEKRKREEQQRLAAEEKAAKEREAAAKQAAKAAASLNVTVDIERSVMSTPVGKGGGLNVTMDIEKSPQSYVITPKGGNKPITSKSAEDYGMDQNSDDSTDDESAPRKPIPSWAEGHNLQQIIMKQYFNPPDMDSFFGAIEAPKLENIFYKSKPRYFKRTSSAVWHSPPVKN
ncbi:inner centromere protein [Scomber scombrus]|uniref:Inner centromere protein n=1 Tax=Scomber scombrus TaxID=13677 RepID=A0AAV1NQB2_SCOSC